MIVATLPVTSAAAGPSPKLTVAGLVEQCRRTWLADAAAFLRVLDWQGLAGRQVAIIDFDDVPDMPRRSIAFTSPGGLFELVRPLIPRSNLRPGPAMFIDTAAVADFAIGSALDRLTEADAVWIVRVVANSVAIHEYAHAVDFEARGVMLPAGTTLDTIFTSKPTLSEGYRSHGAGWVRAYAHLVRRAMATPSHQEHYLDSFRGEVEHQALGPADDYLDALDAEVDRHGIDLPLVEILRTPAPAGFSSMFDARDAARSANR
jgi:hypothetical protein